MANSRIMLTCRHCGGQTTLAKGNFGKYYPFEDAYSALSDFFEKHEYGVCAGETCCSDDAKDHFVILEKGDEIEIHKEVK